MKKIRAIFICILSAFLCLLCCCTEKGPLPNGKYALNPTTGYYQLHAGENRIEFFLEIKGDKATRYASGAADYKGKFVEREGKLYLEGYTWKTPLLGGVNGSETDYEVTYDEGNECITLTIIEN